MILQLEIFGKGYRSRTLRNAEMAGATVAFAVDFATAGERLTRKAAGPRYLAIPLGGSGTEAARMLYRHLRALNAKTLNVAGNGIYTLDKFSWSQEGANAWVYRVMSTVHKHWPIEGVRSGGQTGIDIAGLVAAVALGIPATGCFPAGFLQRGTDGIDGEVTESEVRESILDFARCVSL